MELIHCYQAIIKGGHAKAINGKAEGCVGADQDGVFAVEEGFDRVDLAAVLAGCVAQVPFWLDRPIPIEAMLGQRFIIEAGADGLFRDNNDGFLDALIVQLVERNEHQCTAFP